VSRPWSKGTSAAAAPGLPLSALRLGEKRKPEAGPNTKHIVLFSVTSAASVSEALKHCSPEALKPVT